MPPEPLSILAQQPSPEVVRCSVRGLPEAGTGFRVEAPGFELEVNPEALLSAMLPIAMSQGRDLRLPEMDPLLLESLPKLIQLYRGLSSRLKPVQVMSQAVPAASEPARGTACFFSMGLDSLHTFLENREEITHLIWIRGFDSPVALQEEMLTPIRQFAERHGKVLIEVRTNLTRWARPFVSWGTYHGNCLFTLAHLLKRHVSKVYIAASFSFDLIQCWGSHPLVDPLWSCSRLRILHHGSELSRADKFARWGRHPDLVAHLQCCRVLRSQGQRNCGRCEKCIRTMLSWSVAGNPAQPDWSPALADLLKLKANMGTIINWQSLLSTSARPGVPPSTRRAIHLGLLVLYLKAGLRHLRGVWRNR